MLRVTKTDIEQWLLAGNIELAVIFPSLVP